jgi:ubiquinol-cytochrome c reductase cytochrome b subunit
VTVFRWFDDRLGLAAWTRTGLRKVFPDHWTFLFGEVALFCLVVLVLTGIFLTLFYVPDATPVTYDGPYVPLHGARVSAAYRSVLELSFEVQAGLVMRQVHHWAALVFVAAIVVHLLRVFFTGAYRRPREINWLIGIGLLTFALAMGITGYSLPDDLLSGTGLRIIYSAVLSIPFLGPWAAFLLFGGEFPTETIVSRLFVFHIMLLPALLLGLVGVHLAVLWRQKHTQWPGGGATETRLVGKPFWPTQVFKSTGLLLLTAAVLALMGGLLSINPLWKYGPYDPTKVTAGSQPDWYMGWPDGALRIMPGWEFHFLGHSFAFNVFLPIIVLPGLMFTILLLLPFIEAWITGDKREHHLLERPRNAPTRTALMVSLMTFYGLLWAAGGNDIIAIKLHASINQITYFMRAAVFIGPAIAFFVTRRWCISLQRHDEAKLLHGYETGIIMRSPEGGYSERHLPISEAAAYTLTARDRDEVYVPELTDADGVQAPGGRLNGLRAKLSTLWFADNVQKPTREELEAAHHHAEHEHALTAAMDGHSADGHQFDGHHAVEGESLRGGH